MLPLLSEKQKRLFLATEAKSIGCGGISQISKISGTSRVTITQGIKELEEKSSEITAAERIRKKGGGRNKIEEIYPEIKRGLDELLEPCTKGNPENPLRRTGKGMRKILPDLRPEA
jgi:hypothetical protein